MQGAEWHIFSEAGLMFETRAADWSNVDKVIEVHAERWRIESQAMADAAYLAIGMTPGWINRSRAQRARWERQRKGAAT